MRIKPCIERRRWGVIEWLLLSRVGFALRETKKTANSAVFLLFPDPAFDRALALRGYASRDALRHFPKAERGASLAAFPRRALGRSKPNILIMNFPLFEGLQLRWSC